MHYHTLLYPEKIVSGGLTYFTELIFETFMPAGSAASTAIVGAMLVLLCTSALLLSLLLQKYKVTQRLSLAPAAALILLSSYFPQILSNAPVILISLIMFFLLFRLFNAYNRQRCDMIYFDAGVFSTLASLLYAPAILLIPISLLILLRMRSTTFREFVIFLTGIIAIAFLAATGLFWFDKLAAFRDVWNKQFVFLHNPELFSGILLIKIVLIAATLLFTLVFYTNRMSNNLIQIRRYMGIFLWLIPLCGAMAGIGTPASVSAMLPVLIPVSAVIGYYLTYAKNPWYAEGLHALLVLGTILFQYVTFAP